MASLYEFTFAVSFSINVIVVAVFIMTVHFHVTATAHWLVVFSFVRVFSLTDECPVLGLLATFAVVFFC